MIEPFRSGRDLLDEIAEARPGPGTVAVWWLGQSGFLLKSSDATVVIDPYLSEHLTAKYQDTPRPHVRMTRAPFRGADLSGVDLVLASHKHSDHLDPGTAPALLAASPAAMLLLPASILDHALQMGLPSDRLVGMVAGQTVQSAGASVRAVPSAHEGLDTDDQGRHLYLGFVIELAGLRFYHSGDTVDYDGLAEAVGPVDVMFLPVNGRDAARGVPGNMTAAEAVSLANRVGSKAIVPHHFDMFTFNTIPLSEFQVAAAALGPATRPVVRRCGERWEASR